MAAIPEGPLGKPEMREISKALTERIRRGVSIEVWTRAESGLVTTERDVNEHAPDVLALMRQLKTLHPALTFTSYDLEQHASRAEAAGISLSPTIVLRSGGRSVTLSGMFYGPLFPPLLDVMGFLSMGTTPLAAETRAAMNALDVDVEIEAFLTPFDPFSPHFLPLLAAFAVEGKRIKLKIVEASQYPVLAQQRFLNEVPLLVMNGKRFVGYWDEANLSRQIQTVAAGSDELILRERVLAAEYVSEAEARRFATEQAAAEAAGQAPPQAGGQPGGMTQTASGLIVPGRE